MIAHKPARTARTRSWCPCRRRPPPELPKPTTHARPASVVDGTALSGNTYAYDTAGRRHQVFRNNVSGFASEAGHPAETHA